VDPNRGEDEIDPGLLAEPWPTPLETGRRVPDDPEVTWAEPDEDGPADTAA